MLTRRMLPVPVSSFPVPVLPGGRRGTGTVRRPGWQAGALLAAAALLAGCSFDYSESGASAEELLETVPETELRDVTHTVVRGGRLVAEISAEQVQNFPRQRYSLLEKVRYVEYDAAGEAVTIGSAERAVFYSEREDARVAGAIRLRSESQGGQPGGAVAALGGVAPAAGVGTGGGCRARRRLRGARRRGRRGRAPQHDPLHRPRERHAGHRRRRAGRGVTTSPCRGGGTAPRLR